MPSFYHRRFRRPEIAAASAEPCGGLCAPCPRRAARNAQLCATADHSRREHVAKARRTFSRVKRNRRLFPSNEKFKAQPLCQLVPERVRPGLRLLVLFQFACFVCQLACRRVKRASWSRELKAIS